MSIEQTIKDEVAKAIAEAMPVESKRGPIVMGAKVYIRTVTHHYTGLIVALSETEIVLADAAWVADSGRWATALKSGTLDEVEPYPDGVLVSVNRGAVCDASSWSHDLPREQK